VVDHHVDRLDVEAQQCVQLTSTNSSIGLIYALKKILLRYYKNNYFSTPTLKRRGFFLQKFIDRSINELYIVQNLNI
jgi:hypothetical protein